MGLTIDGQELCEAYQEGLYHIRMNCYPRPQPEQVMGITPLADNSESLSCLRGATHRDGRF
jgi:hypothetical protein